jgi:signal transduction histidine kinase
LMQYPVAIMAAGISTVFFAHAILREKLFNPLTLLNEELTQANARLSQITGELQVTNQQLVEANHLKSRFLVIMSHELRTPLNSIIGYTELLLQGVYGEMSEKQYDRLSKVMRNGQHLMQLINDILDLSKIESGHMRLDLEPVDIVSVLAECMTLFEPLAQKKGLGLLREIQPDLPWVMADKIRVLQILMNLISNAVKFTHAGYITVCSQVLDGNNRQYLPPALSLPRDDWVLVGVEDTGIGIASEDQKIVFDEFRQVDGSITREYEGTGLGLAITRKLVEMMNGHIWLESKLNQGSTFWLLLPIAEINEKKPTGVETILSN